MACHIYDRGERNPYCDEEKIPRAYQTELEEKALQKNTIIHLPTGSGKTFIAIQLIKRMKQDIILPWSEGGKRTVFLVNNVPLVQQQKLQIMSMLPDSISIGGYSSEDKVDLWDSERWQDEIRKNQIMVMTSQIFLDMLHNSYITLMDTNLLIFDECHHAVEDHPMRQIMKSFEFCPADQQPRVIGLTATLLNANVTPQKVEEYVKNLETTFHASIASINDAGEVQNYSTNPTEVLLVFKDPGMSASAAKALALLDETLKWIEKIKLPCPEKVPGLKRGQIDITRDDKKKNKLASNAVKDIQKHLKTLGLYGASLSMLAHTIQLERYRGRCDNVEDSLFLKIVITKVTHARAILEGEMSDVTGIEKIRKYSTDQILTILRILKKYSPGTDPNEIPKQVIANGKRLCAIIFTRERFTAKILYNILKQVKLLSPSEYDFLEPEFVVGVNINPCNDTREDLFIKKKSESALIRFRDNIINCIVATSILEEGVDIPQCSLIIRYDFPQEYRSYVQSKGRARNKESCFVLMMASSERKMRESKYHEFQAIEKTIDQLLGDDEERETPSNREIRRELYEDEDIPPFVLPTGAMVTETSSISLINRYCSLLPRDQFTQLTPNWIMEGSEKYSRVTVTIIMPLNCPVKEPIRGLPLKTLKSAKRSAALNTCKRLHEMGVFEPGTFLPKPYAKVDYDALEIRSLFPHWNHAETQDGLPNPGTKKRIRRHKIVFPECLRGPEPWTFGTKTFYLHVINLKTMFNKPTDSRDLALYEMLHMNEGYALITCQPLPRLCEFPLFLKVGEVVTDLEVNYDSITLNLQQYELIKRFHYMIFNEVLRIAKKFNVYDGTDYFMFVVPINKTMGSRYSVDWDVINTYTSMESIEQPTVQQRKTVKVSQNKYKYSVVTPWYRGPLANDRYVVTNVLEYMTPNSLLENSEETFRTYYRNKYNLEVIGPDDQPLLEVKNITSRMNCLLPRAATLQGLTSKQLKSASSAMGDSREAYQEIFVPEFCILSEFPGVFWLKGITLPSVLHRITMLLQADELRRLIARFTGFGVEDLPSHINWQPITLDRDIARTSLLSACQITELDQPADLKNSISRRVDENEKPKATSMKENLFKAKMQKLDKQFSWDADQEPIDIDRNLFEVTLADVQCYDNFVTTKDSSNDGPKSSAVPPNSPVKPAKPAILPPPIQYKEEIRLLSKANSKIGIELKDITTALTIISSNDIFNLERMETLGDAFLKFATTAYLYHAFPKLNEGQLTNIKCKLLGNRNLFHVGNAINLAGRMKVEQLAPRGDFLVPGFAAPKTLCEQIENDDLQPSELLCVELDKNEILSGSCLGVRLNGHSKDATARTVPQTAYQAFTGHVVVNDKCVADCVEGLLGAYLEAGGPKSAHAILQWLQVLPRGGHTYESLMTKPQTVYSLGKTTDAEIDLLLDNNRKDVESILDYRFRDPSLLLEALSHSSYIRNTKTISYERLEFLGDAILDFLITSYLYENYKTLKPGQLTDLRSALVNNVTFASYVVKLKLDKFLLSSLNPTLYHAILKFQEHQQQRNYEITEGVLYLIDEEDCKMAEYVEVPKVLSDMFESLAAAIYLDSGGNLSEVWRVYYRIMHAEIARFAADVPIQPVRMLLEKLYACPEFVKPKPVAEDIPVVMVAVKLMVGGEPIVVHGFGTNKAEARRAAAKLALKTLSAS